MAGITIDGLASGLDTQSVISQLMAIEQQPVTALTQRKTNLQSVQGIWKDINTRLLSLQSRADTLKEAKGFNSVKAASSDATIVTASATSDALVGSYQVSVSQLAKAQVDASNVFDSTDKALNLSGDLTINGSTVTIQATDTLASIKDRINKTTGTSSVSAAVVQTAPGKYQLILSGTKTGVADTVTWSGGTGLSFSTTQAAQQAKVTINGLEITSNSNTISDAAPGVTLSLLRAPADPAEPLEMTVTVNKDIDGVVSTVKGFVDQINSLITFISDKQTYDKDNKIAGALLGDATATGIVRDMRNLVTDRVVGIPSGQLQALADIGITTGKWGSSDYGKVVVDESKLRDALANKPDQVIALFTGDNGVATKVSDYAAGFTDTGTGVLPLKDKDITAQIKDMTDQIDRMNTRLEARQALYEQQFTALETALSTLKNQQTWLTQQLDQMSSS